MSLRNWAASLFIAMSLAPVAAAEEYVPEPEILFGGEQFYLHSKVLGDDRQINVWYPAGYGDGRPLAGVIYLLDGGDTQDFPHIAGLGQLGALSWTFKPFLVVGIETQERQYELTPPPTDERFISAFPESGGAPEFRQFILNEVKPFIEGRYRTGRRDILMGESLAGLFVIDTLLEAPESFDDYIAISPSLWWDGTNFTGAARGKLDDHPDGERRLYLALADEGGMMEIGVDILRAALSDVGQDVIDFSFHDFSATHNHATIYHTAALDAFRTLYAEPEFEFDTPWWMDEFGEPPAEETGTD